MNEKQKCSARVSGEGRWGPFHQHPCQKAAKIEREGKWYCGTHDPVAKKKRDETTRARWQAKFEADVNRDRIRSHAPQLLDALSHQIYRNHPYSETCDACLESIKALRSAKGETL